MSGPDRRQGAMVMLTGDQIKTARRMLGISQGVLARQAGLHLLTVHKAEAAKARVPDVKTTSMRKIVLAFEAAGLEFRLSPRGAEHFGLNVRPRSVR